MTTKTIVSRSMLLAAVFLVAACQHPSELRVPLDYRPTDRLALTGLKVSPGTRVGVRVSDERTDATAIGRNTENESKPIPIYATQPPPDGFVRDAVARELGNAGIPVEPDPKSANKVLKLGLKQFWADETSTYHSTVRADADLTDASGKSLWRGQVSGDNQKFGRSLSAENYQESLSDAVVDLVQNLLRNPTFVEALNAPPSHTPEARHKR